MRFERRGNLSVLYPFHIPPLRPLTGDAPPGGRVRPVWKQLEGGPVWHHIRVVAVAEFVTWCGRVGLPRGSASMMTLTSRFCPDCLLALTTMQHSPDGRRARSS